MARGEAARRRGGVDPGVAAIEPDPLPARGGTYYAEFFRPRAAEAAILGRYEERVRRHPGLTLNLLARRIGHLAPDPGGIAVWTIPSFAALEGVARELEGVVEPVELVAAGTYADIGREILRSSRGRTSRADRPGPDVLRGRLPGRAACILR